MFIRQGIVCTILGLALTTAQPLFAQNKPADLPIDPRVRCVDGQEPYEPLPVSEAQPASKCTPPVRVRPLPVRMTLIEAGDWLSLTLVCSPMARLTGHAALVVWENMSAIVLAAPTPPAQETPRVCPSVPPLDGEEEEDLDPIFRDMLRKTKPLGLVPTPQAEGRPIPQEIGSWVDPLMYFVGPRDILFIDSSSSEAKSFRGEYVVRADGTIDLATCGSVYVLGMTMGQLRMVLEFHLAERLPQQRVTVDVVALPNRADTSRSDGSNLLGPTKDLILVDFRTEPSDDAARRNCPRIPEERGTILYINPPPRQLTIVDQ